MKKLLSILSAVLIVLSFAACGKADNASSEPDNNVTTAFVKPANYATVLLVTINPQFRLYLDADGNVLAIEPVNKDAEDIQKNITFEHEGYEKVIESIITTANENGFIKEDATVKFEIIEDKLIEADTSSDGSSSGTEGSASAETGNTSSITEEKEKLAAKHNAEILTKAQAAADNTAKNLNIKIDVKVEIKNESGNSEIISSSSAAESSKTDSDEAVPVHTHSFSAATCTQPKKCSCGAAEGNALGHSYKDGVCTRCKAKDPNYITPITEKAGEWTLTKLSGGTLNQVYIKAYKMSGFSFAKCEAWDSLSNEIKNNANQDDIITYNGVKYLVMIADGFDLTITEDNKTVTVTDDSIKLVLSRTDDNTLKVTVAENIPSYFPAVAVGDLFKFTTK